MVETIHSARARARNIPFQPHQQTRSGGEGRALTGAHPGLVDHPLLSPDDQWRLVAAVDEANLISIDDLVRVIPDHPQPISAILVLVDAGILSIDQTVAFDAATQLWRCGPAFG